MKVEFAPGCFDGFDGTQEELDELMQKITDMFSTGEIPEGAEVVAIDGDDYFSDEEILELLSDAAQENPRTLH